MELAAIDRPYGYSNAGLIGGINSIYLWEIPSVGPAKYEWPMYGHDGARSGRLILGPQPTPPPATPTNAPTSTPVPTSTPTPVPSDNTAPTVSITNPLNGSTVAVRSTVNISANASDSIGVTRVEFYIGGKLTCYDTIPAYTCTWKVPSAKNKKYTIIAKALDSIYEAVARKQI